MNQLKPRSTSVVSVGECMVELARGDDERFALSYGGDTFNAAVYLARAGIDVSYATALGDDPYSAGLIALAARENVCTNLIAVIPGRMPGLYLIETREGERTFHYWRDRSPARELFELPQADGIAAAFKHARVVCFSAITLSLYSQVGLARFAEALAQARAGGTLIVMDGNYRPRGWPSAGHARETIARFWALADLALPTFDDEALLWGDADSQATAARLLALGVEEIAIKLGRGGALAGRAGALATVAPSASIEPIDTTGAGDSFNAAYLAARLRGQPIEAAARAGNTLAGIVIRHRGAIAPKAATDILLNP
ncbi:MAG: sugar kinase [Hyphomicrobiaceae bacterium]